MNIVMLDNQIRDHIITEITNLFQTQINNANGTADHIAAGEAYYDLIYGDYVDILNQSPPPLVQPATKLTFNFNTKDFLLPLSKPRRVFAHSTPQQLRPELFLRGDNPALKDNPETQAFRNAFHRWYRPVGQAIQRSEKWTREIQAMINSLDTVNLLLDTCPPFIDLLPADVKRALLREDGDVAFIMGGELVKATAEVVTLLVTEKVTGRLPPLPNTPPEIPQGPDIPVTGTYGIPQAAFAKSIVSTSHVTTVFNPPDLTSPAMQAAVNQFMSKVNNVPT
jgi:hypothetical protein